MFMEEVASVWCLRYYQRVPSNPPTLEKSQETVSKMQGLLSSSFLFYLFIYLNKQSMFFLVDMLKVTDVSRNV